MASHEAGLLLSHRVQMATHLRCLLAFLGYTSQGSRQTTGRKEARYGVDWARPWPSHNPGLLGHHPSPVTIIAGLNLSNESPNSFPCLPSGPCPNFFVTVVMTGFQSVLIRSPLLQTKGFPFMPHTKPMWPKSITCHLWGTRAQAPWPVG